MVYNPTIDYDKGCKKWRKNGQKIKNAQPYQISEKGGNMQKWHDQEPCPTLADLLVKNWIPLEGW